MIEYCQIELTKNCVVRVSPEDWQELSQHKWYATPTGKNFYALRKKKLLGSGYESCLMHRELLQPQAGLQVDHINRDTLDNRRENLRIVTRAQNAMNGGFYSNNTSGFKGVSRKKNGWRARIGIGGKQHTVGVFRTREEAHTAYCDAAIRHRGEFVGAL